MTTTSNASSGVIDAFKNNGSSPPEGLTPKQLRDWKRNHTPEARALRARYAKTAKAKAAQKRWRESPEGLAWRKAYDEKRKAEGHTKKRTSEQIRKANTSPAGRKAQKRYRKKVQLAKTVARAERVIAEVKALLDGRVA